MLFAVMMPLSKSIANAFMIVAVIVTIWAITKYKSDHYLQGFLLQPFIKPIFIFLGCVLITIPFSSNILISLREYYHLIGDMVSFFAFIFLMTIRTNYAISTKHIIHSFFVGLFFSCVYLFYQCYVTKEIGLSGLYGNRAFLGFILEVGIPLVLSMALAAKSIKDRLIYGILFFIYTIAILLTHARGPWLGTLVGVAVVFYLYRNIFSKKMIVAALIGISLLAVLTAPFYWERGKTLFDIHHITNAQRIHIWQYTSQMIKDHPLTGIGLGQYPVTYPTYIDSNENLIRETPHAHNSYLMIFAEAGILGFLAFINLLVFIGLRLRVILLQYACKDCAVGFIGIFSAILITSAVDNAFFSAYISKMFWLILGILVYSAENEKKFGEYTTTLE